MGVWGGGAAPRRQPSVQGRRRRGAGEERADQEGEERAHEEGLRQVGEQGGGAALVGGVPPELQEPAGPGKPGEEARRGPVWRVHLDPGEHDQREAEQADGGALLARHFEVVLRGGSGSGERRGGVIWYLGKLPARKEWQRKQTSPVQSLFLHQT